jgi:CheY-like chemotaxis protein
MRVRRERSDVMSETRSTATGANGAPRILVVEDEPALALLLAFNLEAEGFVVDRVERGDEAEVRLQEASPDLVLLDWMLPGVSGLELCRRLRAREATRTLPVIMLTARGEEAERVRGLGAKERIATRFALETVQTVTHIASKQVLATFTSKRTPVAIEVRVEPRDRAHDVGLLRPEAFEWPVHLDMPPHRTGQVRATSGFARFRVPRLDGGQALGLDKLLAPGQAAGAAA